MLTLGRDKTEPPKPTLSVAALGCGQGLKPASLHLLRDEAAANVSHRGLLTAGSCLPPIGLSDSKADELG